jgi:anti-sigma B factor antagonist
MPEVSDPAFGPPAPSGNAERSDFIVTRPTDQVWVITVDCEVDALTTAELGRLVKDVPGDGHSALVVDFSGCGFMSSSGLAILVEARQRAGRSGSALALVGLNRILTRALDATGLTQMFHIYPTIDDALAGLVPGC